MKEVYLLAKLSSGSKFAEWLACFNGEMGIQCQIVLNFREI